MISRRVLPTYLQKAIVAMKKGTGVTTVMWYTGRMHLLNNMIANPSTLKVYDDFMSHYN